MNTCTHMGKPTHKNKYVHIVQNRINQIYLLRNYNVTTICKKSSLSSPRCLHKHYIPMVSSFRGSPCQHHMADTGWRKLQLLSKILQKLIKKITTSPLARILETGSFENAGGRSRVTCHLQGFCSKVKSHIQISTATLPSVLRARKHRRRKSSKAALVQTFLVLRHEMPSWSSAPPKGEWCRETSGFHIPMRLLFESNRKLVWGLYSTTPLSSFWLRASCYHSTGKRS